MIIVMILLLASRFPPPVELSLPLDNLKTETMTASWYGGEFHGQTMANGETFNRYAAVVAHRDLPFGTELVLLNPQTGRSAEAVVKDRGPFVADRDLDVSEGLAHRLGFYHDGVEDLIVVIKPSE